MIKIHYSNQFKAKYKRRISKNNRLVQEFLEAVETFQVDRSSSAIKDHPLGHKMYNYRAFSINSDIRVIYLEKEDHVLFVDIGTHEQVYQR